MHIYMLVWYVYTHTKWYTHRIHIYIYIYIHILSYAHTYQGYFPSLCCAALGGEGWGLIGWGHKLERRPERIADEARTYYTQVIIFGHRFGHQSSPDESSG